MSALEAKALKIRAPNDSGQKDGAARTANDFGVLKCAVTTTYGNWALPREFSGKFAKFLVVGSSGDTAHVAFSKVATAEVSTAASAAASGATPVVLKVGWPLQHGVVEHMFIPDWNKSEQIYMIVDGSASVTLYVALADGH